jgi:hypothetical protein
MDLAQALKVYCVPCCVVVIDEGTRKSRVLLRRASTMTPVVGARFSLTVHVDLLPGVMEVGEQVRDKGRSPVREMLAVLVIEFREAVTIAVWSRLKKFDEAVNCAEVAPACTVTGDGTAKFAKLVESATDAPPEPAALVKLTVQVAAAPDRIEGVQLSPDSPLGGGVVEPMVIVPLLVDTLPPVPSAFAYCALETWIEVELAEGADLSCTAICATIPFAIVVLFTP